MFKQLSESSENVLGFMISDSIRGEDVHEMGSIMADAIYTYGSIRLLMEIEGFRHMEPEALLEKLKFAFEHSRNIERMAVVSDRVWIKSWLKVGGLFTQIQAKHFLRSEMQEAWQWLRS